MYNLNKIDARIKLLMLLAISSVSIISRSFKVLLPLLAFTLLVLLLGKAGLGASLRRLRSMLGLVASVFIIQCLLNRSGEPFIILWGFCVVTYGGFNLAAAVTLRLLVILFSTVIIMSGDTRDYLLAFNWIKLPYEISFMVLIALRFIPLIRDEAQDVFTAVQMRGTKLKKTSLRHKATVYISMMIPIAAGAIARSEQLSVAMEARAFRALPKRTYMRRLRFAAPDFIMLTLLCIALAAILLLNFML